MKTPQRQALDKAIEDCELNIRYHEEMLRHSKPGPDRDSNLAGKERQALRRAELIAERDNSDAPSTKTQ